MKIDSLQDLDKLLTLCRKRGVESVKIDGIEFKLGDEPVKATRQAKSSKIKQVPTNITEDTQILTPDMPTMEQLLFGSSDPTVWSQAGND